jgi:integrase
MYSKNNNSSTVIKKYGELVTVSVVLRNSKTYQVTFARKTLSFKTNETECHRIAKSIAHDLDTGNLSLDDLKPLSSKEIIALYQKEKSKAKLTLIESITQTTDNRNIKDIWEKYKRLACNYLAKTTVKNEFKKVDLLLEKLTDNELLLCNIDNLGNVCIKHYSVGSLKRIFESLQVALNVVINNKPIGTKKAYPNDYKLTNQLPKQQKNKTTKKFYKPVEIQAILNAFKNFVQKDKDTTNNGSNYYYPFTLFCTLTGCRPSEVVALRFTDIKISKGKVQVLINKAYSKGVLNNHTKNYKVRLIPLNPKLATFMINYCIGKNKNDLVFPSVEGNYLDHDNYNQRHFKPIVQELVNSGKLKEYLSPYHLRHSFATNMLRQGVDIATIAGLLGDNIQTIINHYIGSDYENANLPDIY